MATPKKGPGGNELIIKNLDVGALKVGDFVDANTVKRATKRGNLYEAIVAKAATLPRGKAFVVNLPPSIKPNSVEHEALKNRLSAAIKRGVPESMKPFMGVSLGTTGVVIEHREKAWTRAPKTK